jgi:hypothetical protein
MGITVVSCVIIEFEERRLSLLRERGKHDCIVGVMISLLIHQNSRRKTIFYNNLVQAYIFAYYYFKHALFILT